MDRKNIVFSQYLSKKNRFKADQQGQRIANNPLSGWRTSRGGEEWFVGNARKYYVDLILKSRRLENILAYKNLGNFFIFQKL